MARSKDGSRLDEGTVARLVEGSIHDADVPPAYAHVASVLAAASAGPDAEERYVPPEVGRLLAAAAAQGEGGHRFHHVRRPAIVLAAVSILLVATAGLGIAGALPDGAQRVARTVLDTVGIHVRPGPDPNAGQHPFERGRSGKTKEHVPGAPAGVRANLSPGTPRAAHPERTNGRPADAGKPEESPRKR